MTTLPLTYYAQFRDASGNLITGTGGQTWFAIGDMSVDQVATLSISASSKPALDPLHFTLGPDTIDPALLAMQASGAVFSQVEVAGYTGSGSSAVLVTDDVYKNAAIETTSTSATGVAVALEYADTLHRFYPATANGSAGTPVVAGYNGITGAADAPAAGVPATSAAIAPLTFFVQFRDGNGIALAGASGQTWFAVTGLSVSAEQSVDLTTSTSGAGTIAFDPLTFTIDPAAAPLLLQQEAAGTAFGAVELAGYAGAGATAALIEDVVDKGATVASLQTGADGSQTVALKTTDLVQTVMPAAASDSIFAPVGTVSAGWNSTTNQADNKPDTHATFLGTPTSAPVAALTYYVQFRDSTGALLSGDGGQTWFAASDVGFGSTAISDDGATFTPLTFTLDPDSILGKLFANQINSALRQIEVAGYDSAGALVADDTFATATATADQANANGTDTLDYQYLAATETTYGTGLLGQTSATQGYNAITKTSGTSTTGDAPATPPPTDPGSSGLTYYVQFRALNGTVLAGTGGATWFAVTDVGFTTTHAAGANGPVGIIALGGLSFTLGADTVLPTLFQQEAAGTSFQSVELAGYAGTGSSATLVQDDLMKLAATTNDTAQTDGTATLTLKYGGLLETAYTTDANGKTVAAGSNGWNAVKDVQDNTTAPPSGGTAYALAAPLNQAPTAAVEPGPLTYYVQIRNYGGSLVKDATGATWFAATDVSLSSSETFATHSGDAAGVVEFNPASITITDPALAPQLFVASAQGKAYESVEIAGYSGTGSTATLVQDNLLKLAGVATVATRDDSSTAITLQYGGLVEHSYATSATGTVTLAKTGGWNSVDQVADTGTAGLGGGTSYPLAAPLVGTPVAAPAAVPLTYYVEFLNGTTPLKDTTGASYLPIDNLSFETVQTLNIGSQTATVGAGKITFDPLTFTIAPDSVSTTLLQSLASGTAFTTAYLVGYDTSGATPVKTTTDDLAQVYVRELAANPDGSETVKLEYGGLQERNLVVAPDGTLTSTGPTGWDRVSNTALTNYSGASASDTALPTASPACYCPGTAIATPDGDRAVEALAAGDLVLTADGRALPVVWVGRRSYRGRFVAGRRDILPITLRAGALADGIPARDLTVSPEHALLLDGLLVPARALVNGTSITQAAHVDAVHYVHVELPQHEAILAEGAAAESFIDDDSRGAFHNAGDYAGPRRHGPAIFCAPRVEHGYGLEAIRTRLAARAGRCARAA